MKTISLQEACMALGVSSSTLVRWYVAANVEPQTDAIDKRKHFIAQAQLHHIARLHNVQLHATYGASIPQQVSSDTPMPFLEAETVIEASDGKHIARELKNQIQDVATKLSALEAQSGEIETLITTITAKLDTIAAMLPVPKRDIPVQVEHKVTQDVSPGSIPMREFAKRHGLTREYLQPRIERGEIQATSVPFRGKKQYVFSKEQQVGVVVYLKEQGIAFQVCDEVGCACRG